MKLLVKPEVIQAMLLFVARKGTDVRVYLEGIHFEFRQDCTVMTASDGKKLLKVKVDPVDTWTPDVKEIIAPSALFKGVKQTCLIEFEQSRVTVTSGCMSTQGESMDYRYPDTQKVCPRGPYLNISAQFDGDIITAITKACKILNPRFKPVIQYNGDGFTPVDLGRDDVACIVLPLRVDDGYEYAMPAWVHA